MPVAAVALTLAGCANPPMTVVPDRVYRSGQLSSEDLRKVCREHGIRTIVNLRHSRDSAEKAEAVTGGFGVWVVHLPMDQNEIPGDQELRTFFAVMDDPKNYPVLIHCAHGKDRTGMMVALYRIRYQKWPPEKAYEEMESLGHNAWLFSNLKPFVLGFGEEGFAASAGAAATQPTGRASGPCSQTYGPTTQARRPDARSAAVPGRAVRSDRPSRRRSAVDGAGSAEWSPLE